MATQDQFKKFLSDIEPSSTTKTNAQKAHKGLRDFLWGNEEFKEVLEEVFLSGSYKRNTAVRPRVKAGVTDRPDVDVIVIMDYGLNADPEEVLNFLCRVLREKYADVRKQARSAGIRSSVGHGRRTHHRPLWDGEYALHP